MNQHADLTCTSKDMNASTLSRDGSRWLALAVTLIWALSLTSCAGSVAGEEDGKEAPLRQELRIISFNVMCSFCVDDEHDPWPQRLPHLQGLIAEHDPDLIGLQELYWAQPNNDEVQAMIAKHPVYSALYFQNLPNKKPVSYPDATIYYRTERFEKKDGGFFWLSDEPDKPFSGGWAKAQFPRIVAWAVLYDRHTKKTLLFATTHFDNNTPNQKMSAPLLLKQLLPYADKMPMIITGDFNSTPTTEAYKTLVAPFGSQNHQLINTWDVAAKREVLHNNGDESKYDEIKRIDHIFVTSPKPEVSRWTIDLQRFGPDNRLPSDHRLIMATLTL